MTTEDLARAGERGTAQEQGERAAAEPDSSRPEPQSADDRQLSASPESKGPAAPEAQAGSPAGIARQSATDGAGAETALIETQEADSYRSRWTEIQGGFVDEPREALARADQMVAEVIQHLTRTFADERSRLEEQWTRGADVSTEDLRLAFQRYRAFFNGLLR